MKSIGMDAHSRTSTFVVLGKSGKVLRRARVKTPEDQLLDFVRSVKKWKVEVPDTSPSRRRHGPARPSASLCRLLGTGL